MLKEYIEIGYLKNVTDDANIEKLEKSCVDLKDLLIDDKSKIASFTLVALDPEINVENYVYSEVRDVISENWKTFMNSQGDTPKAIIRAVILDALKKLTEDIQNANLVWLASRNIFTHMKINGKEKDTLNNFLVQLGNRVEEQAAKSFGIGTNVLPKNLELKEIEELTIDDETFIQEFKNSTHITSWGGKNNSTPSATGQSWADFFSQNGSEAISSFVNNAIQIYLGEINKKISQLNNFVNTSPTTINNSLQLRTELLWWKEACFSNTLKDTYREKKEGFLQIILAKDYSAFMPQIFPTSANYFLIETNTSLSSTKKKDSTITEILNLIDKSKDELKQHFQRTEPLNERISLYSYMTGYINDIYKPEQFKELVGFDPDEKIGFDKFTTWLFHDLQVLKIINS